MTVLDSAILELRSCCFPHPAKPPYPDARHPMKDGAAAPSAESWCPLKRTAGSRDPTFRPQGLCRQRPHWRGPTDVEGGLAAAVQGNSAGQQPWTCGLVKNVPRTKIIHVQALRGSPMCKQDSYCSQSLKYVIVPFQSYLMFVCLFV